ncbi:MAG: dicarboxylate/amino acid:cation symporter [bacterium]
MPTRILIGMAVGVVVGLLLGPRSTLLERDTLVIRERGETLKTAPDPRAEPVNPEGEGTLLLEVLGRVQGVDGQPYYKVRFRQEAREVEMEPGKARTPGRKIAARTVVAYLAVAGAPPPVSRFGHALLEILNPFGRLFLRLIKMVIVPLVFVSLLLGVASLGSLGKLGRMGGVTFTYFLATTALAITIGLTLANVVKPGKYVKPEDRDKLSRAYAEKAQEKTKSEEAKQGTLNRLVDMVPDVPLWSATKRHPNMLQLIVFAFIMGIGFLLIPAARAAPALAVFESINDVMVKIVELVMELAPFGVLALLAGVAGTAGVGVLGALAAYSGVVLAALAIHTAVTYSLAVRFLARYPLRRFYTGIRKAQLIAFSTSSSSATLPVSIQVARENLGVSNRAAGFVLPLGATVNMDGTALYQGVAAVFIAQVFGMNLTVVQQMEVLFTATLASVGAAGVPGAGIITLAMVLTAIGVPTAGIALILGVDRLLDMFRTGVNVTGDLSATVLVARMTGEFDNGVPPADARDGEGETG